MYATAQALRASRRLPILCGGILLVALALSFLSGFRSYSVPFEVRWQFSPLGLLFGFDPAFLELKSGETFPGGFGLHLSYFKIFAGTVVIEAPFYLWLLRKHRFSLALFTLLAANLLTHPAVFFLFPRAIDSYIASSLSAEVFAAITEAAFVTWVFNLGRSHREILFPAAVIVLANLVSWQVGSLVAW